MEGVCNMEFLFILILITIYVLPIIVVFMRNHPNKILVSLITVLLGWTVIVWIGALIWACVSPSDKGKTENNMQGLSEFNIPDTASSDNSNIEEKYVNECSSVKEKKKTHKLLIACLAIIAVIVWGTMFIIFNSSRSSVGTGSVATSTGSSISTGSINAQTNTDGSSVGTGSVSTSTGSSVSTGSINTQTNTDGGNNNYYSQSTSGSDKADNVFCKHSDISEVFDSEEYSIPINNYKYKLPTGITPIEVNSENIQSRGFVLIDNIVSGSIVYGKKADVEKNICDIFTSNMSDPPTGTQEEIIEALMLDSGYREYTRLKVEEGYTDEELKEDGDEDMSNIDIIDLYIMEINEWTEIWYCEDIFNSVSGKPILVNKETSLGEIYATGYSDGKVTAIELEYKEKSSEKVQVCMIKRIDEGDYVKLFFGGVCDEDFNGVILDEDVIYAVKKLEYIAREFN